MGQRSRSNTSPNRPLLLLSSVSILRLTVPRIQWPLGLLPRGVKRTGPETTVSYSLLYYYYYYYYYSSLEPVWAGTRAQSGDRYGSGTLHPGHVLRGSMPLLSPAFRRSHFRRQVPPREILAAKVGTMGDKGCPVILPTWRLYSRH
jgi:hypothetical protein